MVEPSTLHDPVFRGLLVASFALSVALFAMVCRMERRLDRILHHLGRIIGGIALCLAALLNFPQVEVSEAFPLQITRGANGAWHWGCYIGGKSGLGCTISAYPIDAVEIRMFGIPEFRGPDINEMLTRPQKRRMMMRIDDAEKIKVDSYSPNSFSIFQDMLKGRILRVEYQGMFDAEIHEVEIPLTGLDQSYCDVLHYLRDHGPGVPFDTLPSAPCITR